MSSKVLSVLGFLLAAVAAPPVSVTIYLALAAFLPDISQRIGADQIASTYVLATLMGVIPSALFGGLTLLAMKAGFKPWPPRAWLLAGGGAVAAAAYCVVSTVVGFAPWGRWPIEDAPGTLLIMACVVLSGAVAGLIYAPFVRRG